MRWTCQVYSIISLMVYSWSDIVQGRLYLATFLVPAQNLEIVSWFLVLPHLTHL